MHANEPKRLELANLPTPVRRLENIGRELGREVVVKRDDLTGVEVSGNKVRKLEYVVADAVMKGATTLVTHGGFQSNHCRATAAVAARLGLGCRLILRVPAGERPAMEGNLFLDSMFGAEISYHGVEEYNGKRRELIDGAMEEVRKKGGTPYFFPVGASVPLGTWGYVRCVHELVGQLGRDTKVDLYSAVSSAGTHAGLMLGKALFKLDGWRVIGVPVSDSIEYFQKELRGLAGKAVEEFGLGLSEGQLPIELLPGFIGEGYAIPTKEGMEATRLAARREGMLLDPTYTAKGFAGFLDAVRSGHARKEALPVFVHTGGVFGLMARRDLFL